jgi:hypothetical protein
MLVVQVGSAALRQWQGGSESTLGRNTDLKGKSQVVQITIVSRSVNFSISIIDEQFQKMFDGFNWLASSVSLST